MKKWLSFAFSLLLLLTVGCSNAKEHLLEERASFLDASVFEPTTLDVSDLHDILASVDLFEADLTCSYEGTEDAFPASNAIRAKRYLEKLGAYTWESYQSPAELDDLEDCRYQLSIPGATLTAFQSGYASDRLLHVKTDRGEGWFTLPYMEGEHGEAAQASWMIFDTFAQWYDEAHTAALYGGEGSPLTTAELDWFESYTKGTWTRYDETLGGFIGGATPISCFFTSTYNDPRDMDAGEFLSYCPSQGVLEAGDEEEFSIVQEKLHWRIGEDDHLATIDEMPVPCHRLPRSYINEILTKYAGITVEEMHTDWLEEAFYIPETDCFYTFSSDFGPGMFIPCYGEKSGDTVTLWEAPSTESEIWDMLVLQKSGEDWHILSHCSAAII